MSLSIGSNYTYGGNVSASNYVSGFNTSKIQSIIIDGDDIKKLGIDEDDFAKVDADEDGLITASEFLSSGMSISSIFNAFKAEAQKIDGAYLDPTNIAQNNQNNNQNKFGNPLQQQQQNSLTRPSVANHPFLAKNLDFSA